MPEASISVLKRSAAFRNSKASASLFLIMKSFSLLLIDNRSVRNGLFPCCFNISSISWALFLISPSRPVSKEPSMPYFSTILKRSSLYWSIS